MFRIVVLTLASGLLVCGVPLCLAATLTGQVEIWETVDGHPVKLQDRSNAVVFVTGFSESPDPARQAELAQRNKSFSERVIVITVGQTVSFPNRDSIYHNVWSRSAAAPFDLGLYKAPETRGLPFSKQGFVTVFCNIHPQMIATILVLPNRKFDVTGPDGTFRIEGIPPGDHTVYAWVEGASPLKQAARFTEDAPVKLGFRLGLQRIPINHLDKNGKPYKTYGN